MLKQTLNGAIPILIFSLGFSHQAKTDGLPISDNQFPNSLIIEHRDQTHAMTLTGLAIRKEFVFDIYSMAHYMEQQADYSPNNKTTDERFTLLLELDGAKQISMVFMLSLKAEQIQKSLLEGLKLNSSDRLFNSIEPQIKVFMQAINSDVQENDIFTLRWLPDGTLISLFQGQEISTIQSQEFAKTMWSIWFSDHSVVNRHSLIAKLLSSS